MVRLLVLGSGRSSKGEATEREMAEVMEQPWGLGLELHWAHESV